MRHKAPAVICLPNGPITAGRRKLSRSLALGTGAALLLLAGCTTLGTNVSGSFTCTTAGEGSCAPATLIDDRALARITGETSFVPAGPYSPAPSASPGTILAQGQQPSAGPVSVGQKVLRIVFPAHVDRAGRYHEASIVRAVVDNGQWARASVAAGVPLAREVNLTVTPQVPEAMQAASPVAPENTGGAGMPAPGVAAAALAAPTLALGPDPHMPSAEAVAAARARAAAKPESQRPQPGEQGRAPASAGPPAGAPVTAPSSFNPQIEE